MSIIPTFSIKNSLGLSIDFLENGLIKSISANDLRISLKPASMFSDAGANIFLRKIERNSEPLFECLNIKTKSTCLQCFRHLAIAKDFAERYWICWKFLLFLPKTNVTFKTIMIVDLFKFYIHLII